MQAYVGQEPEMCAHKSECGQYVVVEHNGDVYPCAILASYQKPLANLKENQPKGKSVVKALEKLLYKRELPSLDKPALSENIALRLKKEIEEASPETIRELTPPEQVIEKIVKLVEARWKEKT